MLENIKTRKRYNSHDFKYFFSKQTFVSSKIQDIQNIKKMYT